MALTIRQLEVLTSIRKFLKVHGFSPARSELRAELGLKSHAGVDCHIHSLVSKGWAQTEPGVERSIVLRREGAPLYEPDALRAQKPKTGLRAERPPEPTWINYELLWEMFGAMPDLCLRIRGDAMNRAGVADGGIVALTRKLDEAGNMTINDGDIVAARIADNVVLRRVHAMDTGTFELRPESTSRRHKTIRFDTRADAVEIIGVVIGRMLAGAG